MSTPVFAHSENYGIVYDTDGTQIVVFDEKNALAKISTDYQIITAKISNQGVTAVLVKDGNSSLVWFYDNIGTKLEIEIKNVLGENGGYPIGMDISPSGVGVATPLMSVSGSGYKTDLTFYNFDKGKDNPNRTVGSFEYDGTIFPEMKYLSNSRAVCFGTDKVCFYSLKDAAAPELEKEVGYDNEIVSVITGEDRAVVISKSNMGGYLLTVYNDNGKVIDEENFAFEYTNAEITNGYILVYGTDGALIETTAGHLKYCGEMDGITLKMIPTGKGKFLQFGNYGKRTIKIP